MPFPSVLSSFNRPQPTDRLNSPSHSALHNTVSSAVGQLEAVVGLADSNSVLGTIIGDLRSPASSGGGHIQTANVGGTGQTTFSKGDVLIASNASVLSKLSVGLDGSFFQADSASPTGIKWSSTNASNKIQTSVISCVMGANAAETSVFSVVIPAGSLGTTNAIRATLNINDISFLNSASSMLLKAQYGINQVASIMITGNDGLNNGGLSGKIEYELFANGSANIQRANISLFVQRTTAPVSSVFSIYKFSTGNGSVASGVNATMGATIQFNTVNASNYIQPDTVIIERIS